MIASVAVTPASLRTSDAAGGACDAASSPTPGACAVPQPTAARARVPRDAEHGGARGLLIRRVVADPTRLRRTARRVGLGVEVEDDGPPAQLRLRDRVAVLVGEGEAGGLVARLDHRAVLSRRI